MNLFACDRCGQLLYFENTRCERCQSTLGFRWDRRQMIALESRSDGVWRPMAGGAQSFRLCANAADAGCNWLVPADDPISLCRGCRLNRTIPDLSVPGHLHHWRRLETAKRRVVYGLLRFGLPLLSKIEDPQAGMAFDFLAEPDPSFREGPQVVTGHREGLITINLMEADDAERERHRQAMAEPFRTLLGHFRHEVGHYYWDRLVRDGPSLQAFRALFGDETRDYGAALDEHYASGPVADWRDRFVSGYASAHPWEDWAETWAHYLHIVDTLETAFAYGLRIRPRPVSEPAFSTTIDFDAYCQGQFAEIVSAWLPLSDAVNNLNRSMGQPDLYPFALAPPAIEKLRFVHEVIRKSTPQAKAAPSGAL